MSKEEANVGLPEKLRTIKDAAVLLGLPVWKLSRAAKAGLVPSYTFFNSRRLVRISEILLIVANVRNGTKLRSDDLFCQCSALDFIRIHTNPRHDAAASHLRQGNAVNSSEAE